MWIRIWVRMLNHPAGWLRFLHYPRATAFFQIVGNLHSRSRRCAGLWPEYHFGVRLIPIDGHGSHFHFHGAHIEGTHAVEVLQDAGANGVVVAWLVFASSGNQESGGEPCCERNTLHFRGLSNSVEAMYLSILPGRKSVGNHWQVVSTDACEDLFSRFLVNNNWPLSPLFFVNVASKGLRHCVSALESTLAGIPISVDSKGS